MTFRNQAYLPLNLSFAKRMEISKWCTEMFGIKGNNWNTLVKYPSNYRFRYKKDLMLFVLKWK